MTTERSSSRQQFRGVQFRPVNFGSGRSFERLRGTNLLAPHDAQLNAKRFDAGAALLRLHNRAWKDPVEGKPNPLSGSLAADARAMLEEIENLLHPAFWRIVVRVVFEGADISECRSQVAEVFDEDADLILLDRLRLGLDFVSPMLGIL